MDDVTLIFFMSLLPSSSNQSRKIIMNKSTISGNEIQGNENIQGNNNDNEIQGNENIQGNNNNVDKSDLKVDVTVNLVKNKSVEKTSDGCQEEGEEYEISYIISGTAKRKDKTTLKAIEKHWRGILNAASLTIYDIDEGSIKLFFNGTQEDLEKLENSFKSGELKDIFDIPIEDVSFVENNKQKLALTIAGNVSYTDVAKLKSALTGVDQKEILLQKIRSNRRNFRILNLAKANLSEANLSGAYLSGADLFEAYLFEAYLFETDLSGANLSEADLSGANLSEADLSGADLRGAYLSGANLRGANLSEANLSGAYLFEANLRGANLSGAYLSGADLFEANLRGANLSGADLSGADLRGANLSGAYLSGAYLSGANLSGTDLSGADLFEANLSGTDLSGADLFEANLSGTDLSGADLIEANLRGANLRGADLSGANLSGANLIRVDLSGAYLSGAYLSGAYLRGADLSGVDFEKSIVTNAKFSSSSLGMTIELKQELIEKGAIFEDSLEDPLTLSPLKK